jgi:hypothetical protein
MGAVDHGVVKLKVAKASRKAVLLVVNLRLHFSVPVTRF